MRLRMLSRAQARMARGTTAVAHTISRTSEDIKSVEDWDAAQGSAGKHLQLLSDVKG